MVDAFKCRVCGGYTFGEPHSRDGKGKPIYKYCVEKSSGSK